MLRFSRRYMVAATMALVATVTGLGEQATCAQGGPGGFPGGRPSIGVQAYNACVTTDYAAVTAKALNITPALLRKDLVAGQAIQDIATSANVDPQTVLAAVQAARKVDIDQAVTAGVITQDEATAMETPRGGPGAAGGPGTAPAPNGNGNGNGGGRRGQGGVGGAFAQNQFPDISTIRFMLQALAGGTPTADGGGPRGGGFGGFGGVGTGTFNLVKPYAVTATALNLKCVDLVKTLITPPGKSIVAVAGDQKVDVATLTATLTIAYTDALAQDVTDGVITQDQATQLTPAVATAVAAFINNPTPMQPPAQPTQQAQ